MQKIITIIKSSKSKQKALAFLLMSFIVLGFATGVVAKSNPTIHVNDSASGKMDGSSKHPYKSIQDAIDKAKDKNGKVYIHSGRYKENIVIHEKVDVYGSDKNKVTIEAKHSSDPVVIMNHKTEIGNVTITGGEVGILVKKEAGVNINRCNIRDNKEDGVRAEEAKIKDSHSRQLLIKHTTIQHNRWNGIYSRKREFYFEDIYVYDNKKDGIEFSRGSEGTLYDSKLKSNGGDGFRITLDGSGITIKQVTFSKNDREGLEVKSKGKSGYVAVKKCTFKYNGRWGIAKMDKGLGREQFDKNVFVEKSSFYDNDDGGISPVIKD